MKHDWKVGDTYKDNAGSAYKLVAYVPEADKAQRLVFLREDNSKIHTRHEDGAFYCSHASAFDIVPPKRYVYVSIFQRRDGTAFVQSYGSSEEATRKSGDYAGFVRTDKIEV